MKIRVHFSRRATDEKVWSVITSKACYHVKDVIFHGVDVITEYKSSKKSNPKAFIVVEDGSIEMGKSGVAYISK